MSTPFDEHFQTHYLAFFLRDPVFFAHVYDSVTPELFGFEHGQRVAQLVLDWGATHSTPPGDLIFSEINLLREKVHIEESVIRPLKIFIQKLLDLELRNREFLLKEHDRFQSHQRLIAAFPKFKELMRRGDYDDAQNLLSDVLLKTQAWSKLGCFYDSDPTERVRRREAEDDNKLLLLIPELDAMIEGQKPGKLCVWQSQRSSIGKTCALIHCIKASVLQKRRVLVFTLEDGREEYEDKLDQSIASITTQDLQDRQTIEAALRRLVRSGEEIHIAEFPAGTTKISDLRRYKKWLATSYNWEPDVVVLDYADLVEPETDLKGDMFGTGNAVYTLLKGWARQESFVLWTAAQSGRGAIEEATADQEHMGGSIAKMWVSDLVLSINRTAAEAEEGMTRIYVVKNRGGPARFSRTIRTDFSTQSFWKAGQE